MRIHIMPHCAICKQVEVHNYLKAVSEHKQSQWGSTAVDFVTCFNRTDFPDKNPVCRQ